MHRGEGTRRGAAFKWPQCARRIVAVRLVRPHKSFPSRRMCMDKSKGERKRRLLWTADGFTQSGCVEYVAARRGLMADQKVEFANALRGLAALSVIVSHYFNVFWTKPAAIVELTGMSRAKVPIPGIVELVASSPLNWGPFGVALFFVISGF